MKPYCTTSQVLNQAIQQLTVQAGWNVSEPGTVVVQDMTYTALSLSGSVPVSITYVPGAVAGAEVVTVTGQAIKVQIKDNMSTVDEIEAALAASPAAMALVHAAVTGVAGTPQRVTTAPIDIIGDIFLRIMEAGNEIDTRLAGLGITLPFAVNPPALQDWAMLYARYACLRDLYTGADPNGESPTAKSNLERFEAKWEQMKTGWQVLLGVNGEQLGGTKFGTLTAEYPTAEGGGDKYPNFPNGPYPDLPGVDSY